MKIFLNNKTNFFEIKYRWKLYLISNKNVYNSYYNLISKVYDELFLSLKLVLI